ncbi:GNAT family N-acetyltransferase [Streptomyces spirodelae]|uniref:GNAT family N-acetyltransferase n=1 Tax=Streptomyces spirodelae TaxID=2812904 RepID=A0ABS3WXZ8_9ACTN|nr:GNAT family N-acetyltransferase [Streptomyces spirodelae]MBO8187731.1 GNAT family N-acetyltransferase [Streptomyces spirodelae]
MGELLRADEAVRIRRIADADWDAIAALERDAYAGLGLSEGRATLRSRAAASPGTCFALHVGARTAGYVLALPCPAFHFPDLTRAHSPATTRTGNLHLHDLVVAPALRRKGMAQHLLRHLARTARARGHRRISLVAVGGSDRFWAARGFAPYPGVVPPDSGYGTGALYMSQPVSPCLSRSSDPGAAPQRVPSSPHEVS